MWACTNNGSYQRLSSRSQHDAPRSMKIRLCMCVCIYLCMSVCLKRCLFLCVVCMCAVFPFFFGIRYGPKMSLLSQRSKTKVYFLIYHSGHVSMSGWEREEKEAARTQTCVFVSMQESLFVGLYILCVQYFPSLQYQAWPNNVFMETEKGNKGSDVYFLIYHSVYVSMSGWVREEKDAGRMQVRVCACNASFQGAFLYAAFLCLGALNKW